MQYHEVYIRNINSDLKDIIIAYLPDFGYHQLEETDDEIRAYAVASEAKLEALKIWLHQYQLNYACSLIEETNWNASWESNFQPVEILGKVLIRADFHPTKSGFEHEIILTPKMSFGTGHHATTKMMLEAMLSVDFNNKTVLDFGTGTGILSIMAEKLGAKNVLAIDNDHWSIENAYENISKNFSSIVQVVCTDHLSGMGNFDIILANINKNVLMNQHRAIRSHLNAKGILIISGLLSIDYTEIINLYQPLFGEKIKQFPSEDWMTISFNL